MNNPDKIDRRIRAAFSFFAFALAMFSAWFFVALTGGDPLAYSTVAVFFFGYLAGRITRGLQ